MTIIIGLGNPGKKFQKTRHNLGFRVIDVFGKKNQFPNFRILKKCLALISEKKLNNEKILLAKPQTFMNLSGKSVKLLIHHFFPKPQILQINAMADIWSIEERVWIVHDEIDLPLGEIKIVKNRGAAGHKGVQSIIDELKTKNFVRIRIGIRPKNQETEKQKNIEKFVLQKFDKEEEKIVKEVIKKTAQALEFTLKNGLEKAMSEYNR